MHTPFSSFQTNDLVSVHRGVKFSCHFTLTEVQERWNALLYEPIISKLALQAVKNLLPEVVLATQRKTLFSRQELDTLCTIKASTAPPPALKDFEELLRAHPHVFHFGRTPRCLAHQWQSLKQYSLLPDQSVHPLPKTDANILNFLDAESSINDGELFDEKDELLDHELTAADRRCKKEIRHLEAEVHKWQVLVDKVRGENTPEFDSQTLAVLRGRLVRYLMRSKEVREEEKGERGHHKLKVPTRQHTPIQCNVQLPASSLRDCCSSRRIVKCQTSISTSVIVYM